MGGWVGGRKSKATYLSGVANLSDHGGHVDDAAAAGTEHHAGGGLEKRWVGGWMNPFSSFFEGGR